ncbi:MAG: hypothetical protein HYV07_32975 [Deltaproteobacteria bacterium]|nr:hypothetical protein [Deltaproteobacteria bacterium]
MDPVGFDRRREQLHEPLAEASKALPGLLAHDFVRSIACVFSMLRLPRTTVARASGTLGAQLSNKCSACLGAPDLRLTFPISIVERDRALLDRYRTGSQPLSAESGIGLQSEFDGRAGPPTILLHTVSAGHSLVLPSVAYDAAQ